MLEQIKPIWTEEQVKNLNENQTKGMFHPFTGPGQTDEGVADMRGGHRGNCPDGECLLVATVNGWVCPCGQYTQNWGYQFMAESYDKKEF